MSHRNMVAATASIASYLEITRDEVILCVLPLAFDYGLYQMILAFSAGARIVLERSFAFPAEVQNPHVLPRSTTQRFGRESYHTIAAGVREYAALAASGGEQSPWARALLTSNEEVTIATRRYLTKLKLGVRVSHCIRVRGTAYRSQRVTRGENYCFCFSSSRASCFGGSAGVSSRSPEVFIAFLKLLIAPPRSPPMSFNRFVPKISATINRMISS